MSFFKKAIQALKDRNWTELRFVLCIGSEYKGDCTFNVFRGAKCIGTVYRVGQDINFDYMNGVFYIVNANGMLPVRFPNWDSIRDYYTLYIDHYMSKVNK